INEKVAAVQDDLAVDREPGVCSKVVLYSRDPLVDCIRSCLGERNRHMDHIAQQLGRERIDLIPWTDSPDTLIAWALVPARIEQVALDYAKHQALITVT